MRAVSDYPSHLNRPHLIAEWKFPVSFPCFLLNSRQNYPYKPEIFIKAP